MGEDCKRDWESFSNFTYCKIHKLKFENSGECQKYVFSKNHKQLQAITSNSQKVQIRRKYDRKVRDSVFERFHNFGVKYVAQIDWDALFQCEEVRLNNNVSYKRLDFELGIVKVFRKSILITLRSSQEIKGLLFKDAELISKDKVNQIIQLLPKSIKLLDAHIVNTHNAFVNHPTAKHNVNVSINGELRLISDNSKGSPEFEAINPKFVKSDSEILERFNEDLISNNPDPLSVQSNRIKFIEDSLINFSVNMNRHVSVMEKIEEGIVNLNNSISPHMRSARDSDHSPLLPAPFTISKYDVEDKKALRLKFARKYSGFGRSIWGDE